MHKRTVWNTAGIFPVVCELKLQETTESFARLGAWGGVMRRRAKVGVCNYYAFLHWFPYGNGLFAYPRARSSQSAGSAAEMCSWGCKSFIVKLKGSLIWWMFPAHTRLEEIIKKVPCNICTNKIVIQLPLNRFKQQEKICSRWIK